MNGSIGEATRATTARQFDLANVFPVMWIPAHLTHIALHDGSSPFDVTELAVVAAALALLVRPRSRRLLLALAGAQVIDWISAAPFNPDHWTLVLAVNLILLFTAPFADGQRRLILAAAPAIRFALLVGYGAAAFAKWNSDFLDAARSCAVDLADQATVGLVTQVPSLHPVLIATTLAAETLVFLGLLVPATRPYGARLGLVFHGLLSLGPVIAVWDFTATLLALFVVMLPRAQINRAVHRLRLATAGSPVVEALSRHRWLTPLWLALVTVGAGIEALPNRQLLVWATFTPYLLIVAYALLPGPRRKGQPDESVHGRRLTALSAPVLLFLVFTVVNPYIGLRTTGAFTMFSNLRTEGAGSNHFLVEGAHLTDHQHDLFIIEASNSDAMTALADDDQAITVTTLRQMGLISDGYTIVGAFENGGSRMTWTEQTSNDLLGPMTWFERWLLSFRPVAIDGHPRCGN